MAVASEFKIVVASEMQNCWWRLRALQDIGLPRWNGIFFARPHSTPLTSFRAKWHGSYVIVSHRTRKAGGFGEHEMV